MTEHPDNFDFESDDDPEEPGYFRDDGRDLIPKPSLCVACRKQDDPDEEILCTLTRLDQRDEEEFICFAYETIGTTQ